MFVSLGAQFLPTGRGGKTIGRRRHQPDMAPHRSSDGIAECLGGGASADVTTWRRCRLLEAGFEYALADRLATSRSVDVHALLQLVDRGCPPALAARILTPVDDAGAPA